jgi:hypothetical protein
MGLNGQIRGKMLQIGDCISMVSDMVCILPPRLIIILIIIFPAAQQSNYEPEKKGDYSFAPETLLQSASCSPQTDIWMLGYMASHANRRPFFSNPFNPNRRSTS